MPRRQQSRGGRGRAVWNLGNLVESRRSKRKEHTGSSVVNDITTAVTDSSISNAVPSGQFTMNQYDLSMHPIQPPLFSNANLSQRHFGNTGFQSDSFSSYQQGQLMSTGQFTVNTSCTPNTSSSFVSPQIDQQTSYPVNVSSTSNVQPLASHDQHTTSVSQQGVCLGDANSMLQIPVQQLPPIISSQQEADVGPNHIPEGQGNIFLLQSVCSNMTMHVSQKIKEQIWNNQFIQLECLLDKNSKRSQSLKLIDGKISIDDDNISKDISSISMWTDAFMIFIQVMLMKNTSLASDLIQYMHTIRLAARRSSTGWIVYDKLFRRKLSQYQSSKWSVLDGELWLLAMTPQIHQPLFKQQPCFHFNNKGFCPKVNCPYQHLCKTCKGAHSSNLCKQLIFQNSVTNFRPRGAFRQVQPRFSNPRPFVRPRPYAS